ncbi:hypothetical protein ABTE06_22020, partial [Acinetobacter baumannii]
ILLLATGSMLLGAGGASSQPAASQPRDAWVVVTRPMVSCSSTQNDPALIVRLREALSLWMAATLLPRECSILQPGKAFMLDRS